MLSAPENGWTDFQLGSAETVYSLSFLTDVAVEWMEQAIHGLKTLEPFSVHGYCEPGRMVCTVSYWNCYIIFEGDDKGDLCESVYTVHVSMLDFCSKLAEDIFSSMEAWVHWNENEIDEDDDESVEEAFSQRRALLLGLLDTLKGLIAEKKEDFGEGCGFI